jgi:uncharacterized membrane protein
MMWIKSHGVVRGPAMPSLPFILTLLAALGSGMMAGLFFAFSTFVMQALANRPAPVGIAAMQSINQTILKPIFFLVFFGSAVASVATVLWALLDWSGRDSGLRLAGALLYLVGSIGVTMRCNVPLNLQLDKVAADSAEGTAFWSHYLRVWTRWNHVRTVACIAASVSFILGMP